MDDDSQKPPEPEKQADGQRRAPKRSSVSYPYFDHDSSLDVARKIHEGAGGSCEADRLAALLGYKTTNSGTFQTRLSAAKQFGYVRADGPTLSVTDRAKQALHPVLPEDETNAKSAAFLSVELFGQVYERFKGGTLPPRNGLKNHFQQAYGLGADRLEPAVRVLMDSAQQTGFFHNGDQTRLIKPSNHSAGVKHVDSMHAPAHQSPPSPAATPAEHRSPQPATADAPAGVHTAIVGLLRELPPPGAAWSKRGKGRFVKAFLATLDFVYPDEDEEDSDLSQ